MLRNVLTLALLFALVACAREEAAWTPVEAPNRLQVDWRSESHLVNFTGNEVELGAEQQGKLARFLAASLRSGTERIVISPGADADRTITARRIDHLRKITAGAAGRQSISVAPIADGRLVPGTALVVVGRYVVSTPNCPNWRKPSGIDPANQRMSNLGCANETNLGLMVADPVDLVVGQDLAPADAEAMALSVRRYREGKVTPLPKETTSKQSK